MLSVFPLNFRIAEPVSVKLRMYIMAPETISVAYFINPTHQVCLCVSPFIARQWLGKIVARAMNKHVIREEFLDTSSTMQSMLYQEKKAISFSHNFLFWLRNSFHMLCFHPRIKA
jgi:hypothetical protein